MSRKEIAEIAEINFFPKVPYGGSTLEKFGEKPDFRNFRKSTLTATARAAAYVAKIPAAVSGQRGHAQTFSVAKTLIHGFALSESEAWPILCEYGGRCLPPWSVPELRHKLASATKLTRTAKPRGHLLANGQPSAFVPSPPRRPEPKVAVCLGRVTLPPELLKRPAPPAPEPPSEPTPCAALAEPAAPHEPNRADPRLVAHTAEQLRRIHKAGWITGTDDPNTRFFAEVIMMFEATPIFEK